MPESSYFGDDAGRGCSKVFTMVSATDAVMAAQPGSLSSALTVVGVVVVLVAVAGLQAVSMWRSHTG